MSKGAVKELSKAKELKLVKGAKSSKTLKKTMDDTTQSKSQQSNQSGQSNQSSQSSQLNRSNRAGQLGQVSQPVQKMPVNPPISILSRVKGGARTTAELNPGDSAPVAVLTSELVAQCRKKLLDTKADILNRVREARQNLDNDDKGGDEADQTVRVLAESEFLTHHERLRHQLLEIEMALGRIETGTYGYCEETEEPIEVDRLLAIPWTRLSIEGAEIRESMRKKYAR